MLSRKSLGHSFWKIFFLAVMLIFMGGAMATEEPKYAVVEKEPPFEIRSYEPMIVAEVQVDGDLDSASGQGFRLIAAYIFGQNQVREKIAMTAPVVVEEKISQSTKIAMTVPVGIESTAGKWTVSFVMPFGTPYSREENQQHYQSAYKRLLPFINALGFIQNCALKTPPVRDVCKPAGCLSSIPLGL